MVFIPGGDPPFLPCPRLGKACPTFGQTVPKVGKGCPRVGKAFPNPGPGSPSLGKTFSTVGRSVPRFGQASPKAIPTSSSPEPAVSKPLPPCPRAVPLGPGFGKARPNPGAASPKSGEAIPGFRQAGPGRGKTTSPPIPAHRRVRRSGAANRFPRPEGDKARINTKASRPRFDRRREAISYSRRYAQRHRKYRQIFHCLKAQRRPMPLYLRPPPGSRCRKR